MTNGVISYFNEENFDECFFLPVKRTIILLLLLVHALVAVIASPHHVADAYFVPVKDRPEWLGKLSFGVLDSFVLKYLNKDILASSFIIQYALLH